MGDESGWCTCRPKFGPNGGFDTTGCPVHDNREREQYERDEEHWQATVGAPPVQDGGRTDDHEYRGSHHQTPGTLQGGRTDAQTIREILDGQPLARRNPGDPGYQAREDAEAAVDRLEARLAAVEDALGGGAGLIAAERQRQIADEGWTAEHDDEHDQEEIACAAATYALPTAFRKGAPTINGTYLWPWANGWYKPGPDRIRELTKAGALIAAEIDRLNRAALAAAADTGQGTA